MRESDPLPWETDADPPQALLAAIGSIILLYNDLEATLRLVLKFYLRAPWETVELLFSSLSNRARMDLLSRLASHKNHTLDEDDAIKYAILCYDICTENRNVIAHSQYERAFGNHYLFNKSPTSAGSSSWQFVATDEELQQCADEIGLSYSYLILLWDSLRSRAKPRKLPDKPALPRKLSLLRLEVDLPDG